MEGLKRLQEEIKRKQNDLKKKDLINEVSYLFPRCVRRLTMLQDTRYFKRSKLVEMTDAEYRLKSKQRRRSSTGDDAELVCIYVWFLAFVLTVCRMSHKTRTTTMTMSSRRPTSSSKSLILAMLDFKAAWVSF